MIALYAELLSTDAYPAGFIPWNGRTTAAVVGAKPRGENAVPLVPDQLLQPILATCPYLVEAVGPRLADVVEARRAHEAARAKGRWRVSPTSPASRGCARSRGSGRSRRRRSPPTRSPGTQTGSVIRCARWPGDIW